jgi:hypothetical protein
MPPLSLPPAQQQAFFEVAATLIPQVLLGGVLLERLQPPKSDEYTGRHVAIGIAIFLVGSFVVFAEVVAIRALVSGDSDGFDRAIVASALVLGVYGVVIAAAGPWLVGTFKSLGQAWWWLIPPAVMVVIVMSSTVQLLVSVVNLADQTEEVRNFSKATDEYLRQSDAIQRQIERLERQRDQISNQIAKVASDESIDPRVQAARLKLLMSQMKSVDKQVVVLLNQMARLDKENIKLAESLTPP